MKKDPHGEKRPRGRPRAFDRDAALETAKELFWRRGYEATSIAALTEAMGLTPPQLYGAFGSKRALFEEAVEAYETGGARGRDDVLDAPTAKEAVAALLRNRARAFASGEQPPGCLVVLGATNVAPGSEEIARGLGERRLAAEEKLRARIEDGIAAGELSGKTDAKALAKFFYTVVEGLSIQARDGASIKDLEAVADRAMHAWPG